MRQTMILILWADRALMQAAEVAVDAKHTLGDSLGDGPWCSPPWGGNGGGSGYWQGR